MGTDIEEPLFQVAVGAGVNGRINVGLGVAGQREGTGSLTADGMDDADFRNSVAFVFLDEHLPSLGASVDPINDDAGQNNACDDQPDPEATTELGGSRWC